MTSDAKLGLLLGLVIIIAIVFSVNGLPKFLSAEHDSRPTEAEETTVVRAPTEDIISTAKDTVRLLEKYTLPLQEERHETKSYNIEIPPEIVAAQKKAAEELAAKQAAEALAAKQAAEAIAKNTESATAADPQKDAQTKQKNEYVVQENENLGVIAKKFYGPEEGKKRANILKIAEYNGLKSPDQIHQGQTLKIPQLSTLSGRQEFVKVESYDSVTEKTATAEPTPVVAKNTVEENPVEEKTPVAEKAPIVAKTTVAETIVAQKTPIAKKTPVVAKTPVKEKAPVVAKTTVAKKTAVAAKNPATEKAPVVAKTSVAKKTTVVAKAPVATKNPVATNSSSAKAPALVKTKNRLSLTTVSVTKKVTPSQYVVKNGDTLWVIAEKQLGDGNRFPEIVNLNKHISSSASLKNGMELELPTR